MCRFGVLQVIIPLFLGWNENPWWELVSLFKEYCVLLSFSFFRLKVELCLAFRGAGDLFLFFLKLSLATWLFVVTSHMCNGSSGARQKSFVLESGEMTPYTQRWVVCAFLDFDEFDFAYQRHQNRSLISLSLATILIIDYCKNITMFLLQRCKDWLFLPSLLF